MARPARTEEDGDDARRHSFLKMRSVAMQEFRHSRAAARRADSRQYSSSCPSNVSDVPSPCHDPLIWTHDRPQAHRPI
jgi:hypothetical protein